MNIRTRGGNDSAADDAGAALKTAEAVDDESDKNPVTTSHAGGCVVMARSHLLATVLVLLDGHHRVEKRGPNGARYWRTSIPRSTTWRRHSRHAIDAGLRSALATTSK